MVGPDETSLYLKLGYVSSFIGLIISVGALAFWLMFALLASGVHVPWVVMYMCVLFVCEIISIILFFWFPWIVVIVGWIDVSIIVLRVVPWDGSGVSGFLHQFVFDILFFFAAHVGFVCLLLKKRYRFVEK